MAARAKRKLSFLPQPRAAEPPSYGSFPLDLGVGELLRMTREHRGQELQSVANQLRIRLIYLQAIEDGRFRDLPGSTYAVGFVRSYADYLDLDSSDVVRRFRDEVARVHGRTKLVFPVANTEGKIPGAAVLLLSVAVAVIVYGGWYYLSSREDHDLQLIAEVPDRLVALPPGEEADASPASTSPASTAAALPESVATRPAGAGARPAAAPSTGGSPVPALADAGVEVAPPAAESGGVADRAEPGDAAVAAADAPLPPPPEPPPALGSASASEAIPPAPAAPDVVSTQAQQAALPPVAEKGIVLQARLDSWIQILDAEGKTIFERILRAGEHYVVPDGTGLLLATGNAGGLDVFIDGKKAPPLGDVGAVRRRIPLDPGQLSQGATE